MMLFNDKFHQKLFLDVFWALGNEALSVSPPVFTTKYLCSEAIFLIHFRTSNLRDMNVISLQTMIQNKE